MNQCVKAMKKKILFIINKTSGTDRQKKLAGCIQQHLNLHRFAYELAYTAFPAHATELAREAAQSGHSLIVAVGGDGSVNEVANGILGTGAVLAILPKGSGNGLARALGIPSSTRQALALINAGHVRSIDVGFANGRLFLSNAGVGFDAFIARQFADKKQRGLINYAKLVMRAFWNYESLEYLLEVDGQQFREKAFFVTVANGNQFGYNFKIAPNAVLDDAQLDVCVMRPLHFLNLPPLSIRSLQGKLDNSQYVKFYRGSRIALSCDALKWMQLDGEAIEVQGRVETELVPQAIQVIVPPVSGK